MATLNENQVDRIFDLLVDHKLTYEALQVDLLDHICCMVEQKMDNGLDFGQSLTLSTQEFGLQNIPQIQEATIYLLTQKLQKMKKIASLLGIISALLVMGGVFFKINHWIGASIMLVLGLSIIGIIVFPMMGFTDLLKGSNATVKTSVISGYLAGMLLSLATLFKIMHWPGFFLLYYTGLFTLVFVFIPSFTIKNYRTQENKLFAVAKSLLILAGISVFWGLLPLNNKYNYSNLEVTQIKAQKMQEQKLQDTTIIKGE